MANWEQYAACREVGPELFELEVYQGQDVADAKTICGGCKVRLLCLDAALNEEDGQAREFRDTIRGGLTPRERVRFEQQEAA